MEKRSAGRMIDRPGRVRNGNSDTLLMKEGKVKGMPFDAMVREGGDYNERMQFRRNLVLYMTT